ncbi:unnamed protein product [Somion occarium]|uniref:F-box domain-containing protein n=1 Tax=Somion occarium TaxID=3059160 RepID=A0ABP1E7A5_9APHY
MIMPSDHHCQYKARVTGDDLPNELLLEIYPLLPLKGLIAARGVSRRWRSLVTEADLKPARRRLLELYLEVIKCPAFLATRADIVPHLKPFDRKAYLGHISEAAQPPEEFEMWVNEWPARAAIGWVWPGLNCEVHEGETNAVKRHDFMNTLGHHPPYIKTVTYHKRKSEMSQAQTIFHATTFLPAGIAIPHVDDISWGDADDDVMVSVEVTAVCVAKSEEVGPEWLVLDGRRGGEQMQGFVYKGGYGMTAGDIISEGWIEYLERELLREEQWLKEKVPTECP